MKCNAWTLALMGAGLVSLPAVVRADEATNSVVTALSATTISGYVDTSAQWNMGTGDVHTPNYAWGGPTKADGFNLNVVELNIEKDEVPTDSWAAGYKVSLLFGPDADAFATQSTLATGASDFAVKQAYVSLHAPVGNGLDFKIGVWDTLIGYEVFESINNPNVTRSYGYSIEPTTHTGIQAAYQFCDSISAVVGIADTFGPQINQRAFQIPTATGVGPGFKAESYKTYMGSVTYTAPTNMAWLAGSTLTGCIINGFNSGSVNAAGAADQTSFYIGGTMNTPMTALKVGACYDRAVTHSQPSPAGELPYNYAQVVGIYASYQVTEKLGLYERFEYANANNPAVFLAGTVYELTTTLQYDLWKNVMTRLEFRWDHAADDSGPYGGTVVGGPAGKDNSYILLANISYKF